MKAFRSLEVGDGECSIPGNPDAIDRTPIPDIALPDPPPATNDPADLFLPPIDPPGYGCAVPEFDISDDSGRVGGIGTAKISVRPAAADETDPCFPRFSMDLHVPLVCSTMRLSAQVRKDRVHPSESPFVLIEQGLTDPKETDTCDQAAVIKLDLPDIRCEMPTLDVRTRSNLWPGSHSSPVFDIEVVPGDTEAEYEDLGTEGIPAPPYGYPKQVQSAVAGAEGILRYVGVSDGKPVYVACEGRSHIMFDSRAGNPAIPGIEAGRWIISNSEGLPIAWAFNIGGLWYPYQAKNYECYQLYQSTYENLYPKKGEDGPIPDPFWRTWYAGNASGSAELVNATPEPEPGNMVAPQSPCPENWPQTPLFGLVHPTATLCSTPNTPADHTKDPCKPVWRIDLNLPDNRCQDIVVCNSGAKFVKDPSSWAGWGDPAADGEWGDSGWSGGSWDYTDPGSAIFPSDSGPYGAPAPSALTRLFAHQRALNSCYPAEDSDSEVGAAEDADSKESPCAGGWDPVRLPAEPNRGKGSSCATGTPEENKCAQQLRFELSLPFGHPAGFTGGVDGASVQVDPSPGIALRITPTRTIYRYGMARAIRTGSPIDIPYSTEC